MTKAQTGLVFNPLTIRRPPPAGPGTFLSFRGRTGLRFQARVKILVSKWWIRIGSMINYNYHLTVVYLHQLIKL